MKKTIAKSKRPEAERAAEWVLYKVYGCDHVRRALRTKYAKVDFFGCDLMGTHKANESRFFVQVTAGKESALYVRRKKLEKYKWLKTDIVELWQLVERQDVVNPAKKTWFFRTWEYDHFTNDWVQHEDATEIKPEWFKAWKER